MFAAVKNKPNGVSLLELMLVLVVVSGLLLLTTRYYQQTRENLRIAQAIEMINNVVNASYKWQEANPDFGSITLSALADNQFLPQSYKGNSNPWKGTIIVGSAGDTTRMTVQLTNIPQTSCENLRQKMLSRALKDNNGNNMANVIQPGCIAANGAQTFRMSF